MARTKQQMDFRAMGPLRKDALSVSSRPVGVTILAVLQLIVAGVMLIPTVGGGAARAAANVGISPLVSLVSVLFLIALALGSGIGMLFGRRWGWWLGAFWYIYAILRNGNALWVLSALPSQRGLADSEIGEFYLRYTARIVVSLLLLLYLLRSNVLEYFRLSHQSRRRLLVKLALPAAAIMLFGGITSYFGFWRL